ncbi:MAG: hypothetical protein GEU75_17665 [Dehalococcoidia bacterium]|nr:hypothetical protein [Dehalococcoidia bacterium]
MFSSLAFPVTIFRRAWMRPRFRAVFLSTIVLLAASMEPRAASADDPTDRVLQLLEDEATGGTVGFYLKEVNGAVLAAHNENFVFEPASTIKALIHFHAMKQVEDGAIINGQSVTLSTQIPWFTDQTNGCTDTGPSDPSDTDTLEVGLTAMMQPSDNRWTQAMRDFFGDANIDATRATLGMNDTSLNHSLGCPEAVTNPNELTLVDAGKLYEGVANGFLAPPTRGDAYALMVSDGGRIEAIIDQEASSLGLPLSALGDFKAARESAIKAGGYPAPVIHRSDAGWAQLAFRDANCLPEDRQFVFGVFIHGATALAEDDIRGIGTELLREQIHAALESMIGCATSVELTPSNATNTVGEDHVVTATVLDDFGNPVSGVTVNFSVAGGPSSVDGEPSAPSPANGIGMTDTSGEATFTYTNTQASADTISATVSVQPMVASPLEDTAAKTWLPLQASINDVTVTEGNSGTTPAEFTVSLLEPSTVPVLIDFVTADDTAEQPDDYAHGEGQIQFDPDETAQNLTVLVKGDTLDESDEQFFVKLSNVPGAIDVAFTDDTGTGTIIDDDRNGIFSCRASVLHLLSNEPVIANDPDVPCEDDHKALAAVNLSAGLLSIKANALDALTDQTPNQLESALPAAGDEGRAEATVASVTISTVGLQIEIDVIHSRALAECESDAVGLSPHLSGSSSIAGLSINGVPIEVGADPISIPLIIGTLNLNDTVTTDNSVTQRAVFLDTLLTDVIIAEAQANFEGTSVHPSGNPCEV